VRVAGVDAATRDRLLARSRPFQFSAGTTIFRQGEPGDELLIVRSGQVHVLRMGHDGSEAVLNVIGPGEKSLPPLRPELAAPPMAAPKVENAPPRAPSAPPIADAAPENAEPTALKALDSFAHWEWVQGNLTQLPPGPFAAAYVAAGTPLFLISAGCQRVGLPHC
jgi:hypothetical protein